MQSSKRPWLGAPEDERSRGRIRRDQCCPLSKVQKSFLMMS